VGQADQQDRDDGTSVHDHAQEQGHPSHRPDGVADRLNQDHQLVEHPKHPDQAH